MAILVEIDVIVGKLQGSAILAHPATVSTSFEQVLEPNNERKIFERTPFVRELPLNAYISLPN